MKLVIGINREGYRRSASCESEQMKLILGGIMIKGGIYEKGHNSSLIVRFNLI